MPFRALSACRKKMGQFSGPRPTARVKDHAPKVRKPPRGDLTKPRPGAWVKDHAAKLYPRKILGLQIIAKSQPTASGLLSVLSDFMRMNWYPPFSPAVCPPLRTAEQRRAVAKSNRRFFLRQMRSEKSAKKKRGGRQGSSVMLSVPSRRWDVHPACAVRLDRNEAGKACYLHFPAGLVNLGNYFLRVGDCEN
jgi:hypothetical protein